MEKLRIIPTTGAERMLNDNFRGETHKLSSGDVITVFPTCLAPLDYFVRENWRTTTQMGNVRSVFSIDALTNGIHPNLIVKSPERIFTKEERYLTVDLPWWGGPRTREKKTHIINNPIVETQTVWEALILLELNRHGIRAEMPQALIRTPEGNYSLVVNEIDISHPCSNDVDICTSMSLIFKETGIIPADDWKGQNLPKDKDGNTWIIDVNRWKWPPHTDSFYKQIIQTIRNSSPY